MLLNGCTSSQRRARSRVDLLRISPKSLSLLFTVPGRYREVRYWVVDSTLGLTKPDCIESLAFSLGAPIQHGPLRLRPGYYSPPRQNVSVERPVRNVIWFSSSPFWTLNGPHFNSLTSRSNRLNSKVQPYSASIFNLKVYPVHLSNTSWPPKFPLTSRPDQRILPGSFVCIPIWYICVVN